VDSGPAVQIDAKNTPSNFLKINVAGANIGVAEQQIGARIAPHQSKRLMQDAVHRLLPGTIFNVKAEKVVAATCLRELCH
jgi:hypothetical protein